MKRVLIVKTGSAAASVRVAHGDYDRWFVRALGPARATCTVVEVHEGASLPRRARGWDAVVVTGSPRSVTEGADWMRRAGEWLRDLVEHRKPVLGVCFGHQLLASALGGTVRRSPRGRELGTVTCALTAAGRSDPVFDGVPPSFEVQATHEDEVAELPPGVERLAGNAHSAVQAFRAGPGARGVQFHPELDAAVMRAMIEARLPAVVADAAARGEDADARVRALLEGIRPTPLAARVLANFVARLA